MTEDEAQRWLRSHFDVSRETWERLERYVALLIAGMAHQNLIAESTREQVWARHIVDSAQLLLSVPEDHAAGDWIDLGSGPGLPGLVVAILSPWSVTLVENRRRRIEFLAETVAVLGLDAEIAGCRVEALTVDRPASIISARAYAPLDRLLASAGHLGDKNTLWLLPKGRSAQNEVASIGKQWQGAFHVKRSVTDADSSIVIAQGVMKRGRR